MHHPRLVIIYMADQDKAKSPCIYLESNGMY